MLARGFSNVSKETFGVYLGCGDPGDFGDFGDLGVVGLSFDSVGEETTVSWEGRVAAMFEREVNNDGDFTPESLDVELVIESILEFIVRVKEKKAETSEFE